MKTVCNNMLKNWVILYHFVEKYLLVSGCWMLDACRSGAEIPLGAKRKRGNFLLLRISDRPALARPKELFLGLSINY